MARRWSELKAERAEQEIMDKARRRVNGMATYDLLEWADTAGSAMSKGFLDYRRHHFIESLEEIKPALIALTALVDELIERHEAVAR